ASVASIPRAMDAVSRNPIAGPISLGTPQPTPAVLSGSTAAGAPPGGRDKIVRVPDASGSVLRVRRSGARAVGPCAGDRPRRLRPPPGAARGLPRPRVRRRHRPPPAGRSAPLRSGAAPHVRAQRGRGGPPPRGEEPRAGPPRG